MILHLLKEGGRLDALSLASRLEVSAVAVRQHLYGLERDKLVAYEQEQRPLGRPAKVWRLTAAADRFFADGHAELLLGLLRATRLAFGPAGLDRMLRTRAKEQLRSYRSRLPDRGSLRRRLEALASIRTEEGYMAVVETVSSKEFVLCENHCSIGAAARNCAGLCSIELEVFRGALGRSASVERSEHLLAGGRRCAYTVRALGVRSAGRTDGA